MAEKTITVKLSLWSDYGGFGAGTAIATVLQDLLTWFICKIILLKT